MKKTMKLFATALTVSICTFLPLAHAQTWKPSKPIEFSVGAGAGGSLDQVARMLKNIIEQQNPQSPGMVVYNRPAGGGLIALNGLTQHHGDAHYLASWSQQWLTNYVIGDWKESPTTKYTTLAFLVNEYVGLAVRADSPLKSANDLVAKMRADPQSVSFAVATALGNHIHIGAAKPLMTAGVDVANMTVAPFKSSAESITALLGGHVDVVAATTANLVGQLEAGKIRLLAISSPQRLGGAFAQSPTWKEQGIDADFASMQGITAPAGLSQEQLAFWAETLTRATSTPEWAAFVQRNQWTPRLVTGVAAQQLAEAQLIEMRAILRQLKLAKQ
ncbi:MAG: tripartite tricarboxylate transporter substrate binding protein [Comamonadaceae bacterium]|nr:tripartite tricarboxylate transporter substrate binding protein [Comamonadaceae bacterium]